MAAVLIIAAVVCAAIAALLGFGVFDGSHQFGWLALGLVFFFAAALVPTVVAMRGTQ